VPAGQAVVAEHFAHAWSKQAVACIPPSGPDSAHVEQSASIVHGAGHLFWH